MTEVVSSLKYLYKNARPRGDGDGEGDGSVSGLELELFASNADLGRETKADASSETTDSATSSGYSATNVRFSSRVQMRQMSVGGTVSDTITDDARVDQSDDDQGQCERRVEEGVEQSEGSGSHTSEPDDTYHGRMSESVDDIEAHAVYAAQESSISGHVEQNADFEVANPMQAPREGSDRTTAEENLVDFGGSRCTM